MGSEWPSYPLEQLCAANTAITYGVVKPGPEDSNGVLFVRGGDILNGQINLGQLRTITHEVSQQYKRTLLKGGEILVSLVGNPGQVAIAPAVLRGANIARQVGLIRLREDIDKQFIKYYLLSPLGQRELSGYSLGSVQQVINLKDLKRVEILLPTLEEQKSIAHILGTLDDKIELNRQMNATLESMAQALFKSWFVDFDPVIDNALAAGNPIPPELNARAEKRAALGDKRKPLPTEIQQLFPDRFTFTEEMGWVPEGWEIIGFNQLADLDTTSVKPFEEPDTVWEHYSIPSFDDSGMPTRERGDEIKSNKYQVKQGAVLSSKLNPETERTWWPLLMNEKTAICSTEFMQFIPLKIEEQAFVYSLIKSKPFQANILERVTGSTGSRQRAQPKLIAKINVIDCGNLLRQTYAQNATPILKSSRENLIQIESLKKLRDTLLPKLLSGQLRIPEAEQQVAEVL